MAIKLHEYTTNSKFGGELIAITFKIDGADLGTNLELNKAKVKARIRDFATEHPTLNMIDLPRYDGWIEPGKYRLITYTTADF